MSKDVNVSDPSQLPTSITLNNGLEMPLLGFGVWSSAPGEETQRAVRNALETGYRHIDTAEVYDNEQDVGGALQSWQQQSDDGNVFVTTKLTPNASGYQATLDAFHSSRDKLQRDVIDLYLMHWPSPDSRKANWQAMEEIYSEGQCRAIGVSNFSVRHLEELQGYAHVTPAVNQVEYNVFLYQKELRDYCTSKGIQLTAYSPLARMQVSGDDRILDIARKHGKTKAQVCIRWILQQGIPTFPKSVRLERIRENFAVFDFALDREDMHTLDALNRNYRCNPDWNPENVN